MAPRGTHLHTKIRRGTPSPDLKKAEFVARFEERFCDPAFDEAPDAVKRVGEIAWDGYNDSRKSPRSKPAGRGFMHPEHEVAVEWLEARNRLKRAEKHQRDPKSRPRVLIINGSPRSEWTCPGEMSKTFRLVRFAESELKKHASGIQIDILDLSRLTSEFGRQIHPCKACVSTAMPLCHWPCSCYPNAALGQTNDWMNEIYEKWVLAHGVMIVTPVHWYQAPSVLKLMIDRLVCADGGNADFTSTLGKHAGMAKEIELKGWDFPKHLAGRMFSVIAHGDAGGAEHVRQALSDWLNDIGLDSASPSALLDRYIGYMKPYASSHEELDRDHDLEVEVRNAAHALAEAILLRRKGKFTRRPIADKEPRPK